MSERAIAAEATLDGIYVVRTSLPADTLDEAGAVRAYKSLALVERAFRCLKTVDLQVRPIYHWLADRVRAHVFLCMLAYHVEWQMRARLKPMLYDDADKDAAETARDSIVAKAQRSPEAVTKQTTGRTEDGLPVHSFHSLLADLATLSRNTHGHRARPRPSLHPHHQTHPDPAKGPRPPRRRPHLYPVTDPPRSQYQCRSMHYAQSKKEVRISARTRVQIWTIITSAGSAYECPQ